MRPWIVLYVVALVVIIVTIDVVFFRDRFWERLVSNVAIVAAFLAFGVWIFRHS
ncbi:MAG: hypothetical protein JOY68_08450 [Candidatus Dormibacteraeota bacterium]|nr:hypothetical protein [Candidatus Dormibacteraeota bacterium]MBV8445866.1 hypothetical protein [Candidatus Dormibacteraeota bacterium]